MQSLVIHDFCKLGQRSAMEIGDLPRRVVQRLRKPVQRLVGDVSPYQHCTVQRALEHVHQLAAVVAIVHIVIYRLIAPLTGAL